MRKGPEREREREREGEKEGERWNAEARDITETKKTHAPPLAFFSHFFFFELPQTQGLRPRPPRVLRDRRPRPRPPAPAPLLDRRPRDARDVDRAGLRPLDGGPAPRRLWRQARRPAAHGQHGADAQARPPAEDSEVGGAAARVAGAEAVLRAVFVGGGEGREGGGGGPRRCRRSGSGGREQRH